MFVLCFLFLIFFVMTLFLFIFMQATTNEDLPATDTPPCDDLEAENTVTDVRQDDKDNFVDAMDDLWSGKDGAETLDEQEAPDGVKCPHTGEGLNTGSVHAPATADVTIAPVIPEVTKSDVVTATLNAEADTYKVDAPLLLLLLTESLHLWFRNLCQQALYLLLRLLGRRTMLLNKLRSQLRHLKI
jgi:hypothetical protein